MANYWGEKTSVRDRIEWGRRGIKWGNTRFVLLTQIMTKRKYISHQILTKRKYISQMKIPRHGYTHILN